LNENVFLGREKPDPAEALFFGAFVVKGTSLEIDRVKRFILEESRCRLIYQHKDERYLRIEVKKP